MKQTAPYPRRSDCKGLSFEVSSKVYTPRPGSFRSRQSSGTSFERIPLYGKHFTQPWLTDKSSQRAIATLF